MVSSSWNLTALQINHLVPPSESDGFISRELDFLFIHLVLIKRACNNGSRSYILFIMRNLESWWASLIYVFDLATFSTGTDKSVAPQTIVGGPVFRPPVEDAEWHLRFRPPGPRSDGLPEPIECDYSAMGKGWEPCHGPDGGCWLKGPNGKGFNITTDYENESPKGITRRYSLDITSQALAPDGVPMAHGKVFNNSYPGPWIQACWGDELEITVRNHLRYNGTTIHWHGIRMGNNSENDGVNGVTQCPIAPNQEMTYKFKTTQYGTSWYHSHYSLQYADGLVGPLTIWGPSSSSYDYAENPILMTDWNHRSAFEDWSYSLQPGNDTPNMTNILLNGQGLVRYDCIQYSDWSNFR